MANYGMKITLPGYDIATATPEQCAVHSSYVSPKVKKTVSPVHRGVVQITFTTTSIPVGKTTLYSFAHGYSYVPSVVASFKASGGPFGTLYGTMPWIAGDFDTVNISADSTNVYIIWHKYASAGNVNGLVLTVSYYVFAESGR